MSETDLIIAFNNEEKAAFAYVYDRLYPGVYYFAKKFVPADDAADIAGDVFEALWKANKKFETIDQIKAYVIVSTRNACQRRVTREKMRTEIHKSIFSQLQQESPDWLDEKERVERRLEYFNLINSIIESLSEEKKNIFHLAFVDGLESRKIAEKLNLDAARVRDVKRRIVDTLKSSLTKKGMVLYSWFLSILP